MGGGDDVDDQRHPASAHRRRQRTPRRNARARFARFGLIPMLASSSLERAHSSKRTHHNSVRQRPIIHGLSDIQGAISAMRRFFWRSLYLTMSIPSWVSFSLGCFYHHWSTFCCCLYVFMSYSLWLSVFPFIGFHLVLPLIDTCTSLALEPLSLIDTICHLISHLTTLYKTTLFIE